MRFLLLTTNFAPRGTSHTVRTVHLASYLAKLDHDVSVLTYTAETQLLFSPADESLTGKLPTSIDIQRIPPGPLHRLALRAKNKGRDATRLRSSGARSNLTQFLVPDAHVGSYRAFLREGSRLIHDAPVDVLVTFAYPFTMTMVGAALKRQYPRVTWVADYGDPWTGSPVTELQLPPWRRKLDAHLEARALARADAVTMTTEPTAQLYRRQFPSLANRIHVVTMGYDPDDDEAIAPAPRTDPDAGKIIMLHAGRLYREARDPGPFIAAVDACLAANPTLAERLRIVLLGEVQSDIRTAMERSAAAMLYEFHNWVAVDESVARMKSADYLLLFGNAGNLQIPGKVFQYIGTGRPIFMTCDSDDDPTVDVLRQYGRATIVPNRTSDLASALDRILADDATTDSPVHNHEQFSWPYLAAEIAAIAAQARVDREATP